ncbi:glycosyltransferase [Streptomyces sp. SCSIO ZS0520]|uniref:glycosyltransferase n=1 Tax=Streptomyces sp. SCSIO ZS0520 TaxID=2892996 RepID=UPI0021D883B4|nr:glycosyltransferase family A protein [Streptomyces sp. SCSIO ZS0520]
MTTVIDAVVVAIPAHNEAATLPETLRTLRQAQERCRRDLPIAPPLTLVVAADSCTDTSRAVAESFGAEVVEIAERSAGGARAAAVSRGLDSCGAPVEATWIATTDADCRVHPSWLVHQLTCARRNWQCVLGTVRLSATPPVKPAVRALHDAHYFAGRTGPRWHHPHVHGANFGIRADTYLRAGGFPTVPHGEDRALVDALPPRTRILRTDACPVMTSGRTTHRAPHGFGAFLHRLDQDHPKAER